MAVRVRWSDINHGVINETSVRIYRSTSVFTLETLPPTPYATLPADSVSFTDEDVLAGVTYYYAVQVVGLGGVTATSLAAGFTTDAGTPPATEFTVTLSDTLAPAALTGFPALIDLTDMPNDFWLGVRSDGGNVRAYLDDGTTLIPIDVTYINVTRGIGRMRVRRDIATGATTVIKIKLLDMATTALAVTDPNGRNAVWAGFAVVWAFPDTVNRTGNSHTQVTTGFLAHSEWYRTEYHSLTGNPHNGISTDGTWFVSCDDIVLRRHNPTAPYAVVQTVTNINTALSAMTGLSNFDHMGDPVCVGTSTFFTVTTNDATYRRFLVEYRTSDLTLLNAWEMTGAQRTFGATVCYNGTHLLIFSFEDDTKFIKYTTSGAYVSDVSITGRPGEMNDYQGSTVMPGGNIYVSGGTNGIYEITPAGVYVGKVYTDPHANIMEGLDQRSGKLWLLKGDGAMITLERGDFSDFRYLHQGNKVYATLPNSQVWSMAVTSRQARTDYQYTYIGLDDPANTLTSTLTGILYDEGSGLDKMGVWNSTDGWLYTSTALTPVAYDVMRLSFAHDGTTERKVRIRKGGVDYTATDAGVSARPTGTNMDFILNSSQRGTSEDGAGYFQDAWLRLDYVSDAWMIVDGKFALETSACYTIT